jgi:glycosyltransferase involved in cell wall biosynthesis
MARFPVFLSAVLVLRNRAADVEAILHEATARLDEAASDYEVIVIDNASTDESVQIIKRLTEADGLPNLQVFALTKEVDSDTAAWIGLENALGDFIGVVDPLLDDISMMSAMLEKATDGIDVVFARNTQQPARSLPYRGANAIFNWLYKSFHGIHLASEAPQYRMLSRRVVNFILQHPHPAITYRHLSVSGGFARTTLNYSAAPRREQRKELRDSIDRGMRLLVSTTRAPMRLVTSMSLLGAAANLLYSIYVLAVWLLKPDVAPGWVSLSLQQSGMFFLISMVLLVLGEYILHMARLSSEGPAYHVAQEFTSARITRKEKLNIEVVSGTSDLRQG